LIESSVPATVSQAAALVQCNVDIDAADEELGSVDDDDDDDDAPCCWDGFVVSVPPPPVPSPPFMFDDDPLPRKIADPSTTETTGRAAQQTLRYCGLMA
jgi:hypothetical protein